MSGRQSSRSGRSSRSRSSGSSSSSSCSSNSSRNRYYYHYHYYYDDNRFSDYLIPLLLLRDRGYYYR